MGVEGLGRLMVVVDIAQMRRKVVNFERVVRL